jgi:MEMO1 family protein
MAIVVPDARLDRGRAAAGEVYARVKGHEFETVIVVSPTRSGYFRRMTIPGADVYRSAYGEISIDDNVRNELCDEDDDIYVDESGHYRSEGAGPQLPFLLEAFRDFRLVPIVMGDESPEFCRELSTALAEVMFNRRALIVATADISAGSGEDPAQWLESLRAMNPAQLLEMLRKDDVEVDGQGAVIAALQAASERRASHLEVVGGDDGEPLGIIVYRPA